MGNIKRGEQKKMNRYANFDSIKLDNGSTLRDVYPTAMGKSIGEFATGATPGGSVRSGAVAGAVAPDNPNDEVAQAAAIGGQVNPLIGGLIFIGLVFGLMFIAKRLGTDDDFKSLKPSVYNVFTVSLAAAAGLPLLKYAAVKVKIPGVSTWILAA